MSCALPSLTPVASTSWAKTSIRLSGNALRVRRRHIQMVFQDTNSSFNPRATVASALLDPLNTFDILPKSQRANDARPFERVGLSPKLFDRPIHELSGGYASE